MSNISIKIDNKCFNDVYLPYLFDYKHRFNVFYGGGGSGKSVFATQKMIIKALNNKRKVLWIRKVGRDIKDSIWSGVKEECYKLGVEPTTNKTDFTMELPNGSIFLFKGLEDVERIKSIVGITDVVIEEATELNEDDFTQLNIRLRPLLKKNEPLPQIFLMFNPVSKENWCYRYWFANGTPKDTFVLHTTYKDNKFLPKEYIEQLENMKETNLPYYRIYALGEFASLDKTVYNNWEIKEFEEKDILKNNRPEKILNKIGNLIIEDDEPQYFWEILGNDFGYINDPSAIIRGFVNTKTKEMWLIDEIYEKGLLNDEIAQIIKGNGWSNKTIIADCAEQKSIEEIRRLGVRKIRPCRKGKDSILQGIQEIQQYKIYVHPRCKNMISEFKNYTWLKNKETGEYYNKPIDKYNHLCDALRYAMQCINNIRIRITRI
ncbi:PBSX family phage terminase large subunit [Clostridium botulinum]|uniref:PBSX family phage terminase large subunit n=1 Tax=Clostridium botulinum TaxID=1491 RepID=UPI0006A4375B|nr:PBSX family phage terminase large subunit [Clostridium botulinum]KOC48358.1 hypothetical protein ADU88_08500 [Clostridium botulinum]